MIVPVHEFWVIKVLTVLKHPALPVNHFVFWASSAHLRSSPLRAIELEETTHDMRLMSFLEECLNICCAASSGQCYMKRSYFEDFISIFAKWCLNVIRPFFFIMYLRFMGMTTIAFLHVHKCFLVCLVWVSWQYFGWFIFLMADTLCARSAADWYFKPLGFLWSSWDSLVNSVQSL